MNARTSCLNDRINTTERKQAQHTLTCTATPNTNGDVMQANATTHRLRPRMFSTSHSSNTSAVHPSDTNTSAHQFVYAIDTCTHLGRGYGTCVRVCSGITNRPIRTTSRSPPRHPTSTGNAFGAAVPSPCLGSRSRSVSPGLRSPCGLRTCWHGWTFQKSFAQICATGGRQGRPRVMTC